MSPKILRLLVFLLTFTLYTSGQNGNKNYRFLDSANIYIDADSKKTWKFLDSIPKPVLKYIEGRVAEYYSVKALIHDEYNQYSKFHQSNILALKYAIKEKNYCIAGQASLNLYTDKYFTSDSADTKYLNQAKDFFKKCKGDKNAILQVEQMQSYYHLLDGNHKESIDILLNKINHYDSIKNEDAYYYMFANYILTANYIELNKIGKAHKHFKKLSKLKNNNTITTYNHRSFLAGLDLYFAEFYFEKAIDSTFYYLEEASKYSKFMSGDALKDYYKLSASAYKDYNIEKSKIYIDSLVWFQNDMFFESVDASVDINNNLLEAETA